MTSPMPKWIMRRYSVLWRAFAKRNFDFTQAAALLHEQNERLVSVVLSDLKKYGWMTITLDPNDSRKRIYTLKSPQQSIAELAND